MDKYKYADYTVSEAAKDVLKTLKEQLESNNNQEMTHIIADDAIIDFIRFLGFSEIADAWEKVPKWYA